MLFVPGGSFEQVTTYLGVLHALRELGVTVWNDARAIERCVDKSTTTFFLQRAGIPTPWTWTGANRDEARAVAETKLAEGHRLVQKPLFGAQGEGLRLIATPDDLAPPEEVNGVYYLQEFIPPADDAYRDWRIFISAGQVAAAMIRHGSSWITNIKQGARAESAIPSKELADLALRAVACVGADYAGVDIIQDRNGAPLVLEVNSMPAWQGLQRVTRTRIADFIVAPFLDACLGPTEGEPAARPRGRVRALLTATQVAQAFRDACLAELDALKPGNVHRFGDDPRMSVTDFETSARVAAAPSLKPAPRWGNASAQASAATIAAVGHNTNLGIVLLSAPLASAALSDEAGDLRQRLAKVLAGLTVEDAKEAYAAIRLANPGGLGEVPRHGVDAEPAITLLGAMKAAEGHDRIAWNYSHDFADIFDLGLPRFREAGTRGWPAPFATTSVYLGFLSTLPDTLIERKFGSAQALEVQAEAKALADTLSDTANPATIEPELKDFDRSLKARGLNPGTSADLTVATLLAASLQALEQRR